MSASQEPRVRFAPAPSGWLHVGGARTALYNWLHARGLGGRMVLRVEDTDAERVTAASEQAMLEALTWLGIDWDEGPDVGGPAGPYRQSQRSAFHAAVTRLLLESGHAYEAFETPEELAAARERDRAEGRPPGYDGAHRDLTDDERAAFREQGRTPVVRLRTPDAGEMTVDDVVRGPVTFDWASEGDFVIERADGSPTFLLASAVDDLAMGITLVARGEDLLSATPRQRLLMRLVLDEGVLDAALDEAGLPAPPVEPRCPDLAHLPLLVGADRRPLSKRHGSVAVEEFRRQGFIAEGLCNALALLGWSHEEQAEVLTVDELVASFSLQRVGRNPATFDVDKLAALNGEHIRRLDVDDLAARLEPVLVAHEVLDDPPTAAQHDLLARLAPLLRERMQRLTDAVDLVGWCFADRVVYDQKAVGKHLGKPHARRALELAGRHLAEVDRWEADELLAALDRVAAELDVGRGKAFQPVRVAVSGAAVSPPLPETLAELDRDLVLGRIEQALPIAADEPAGAG